MEVFPGESHDYEGQGWHTVEPPLGKTEVVDEYSDFCWNNVANSQKTLKQRQNLKLLIGKNINILTSTSKGNLIKMHELSLNCKKGVLSK